MCQESKLLEIVNACKSRNEIETKRLVSSNAESYDSLLILIGDTIDYCIKRGEIAAAFFLLGRKEIQKIKHPYLDFSRIVLLELCDNKKTSRDILNEAIRNYPDDESLIYLKTMIDKNINLLHLYFEKPKFTKAQSQIT